MTNWHPMDRPHTQYNAPRYWEGVTQALVHSNFEQPRVSTRRGMQVGSAVEANAVPPNWQPPTVGGYIGTASGDAQHWRPDEEAQ